MNKAKGRQFSFYLKENGEEVCSTFESNSSIHTRTQKNKEKDEELDELRAQKQAPTSCKLIC